MDARDFLVIAKKILGYNTEACFRTSVSRSYYSAYNYFSKECECLGIHIPRNPSGHEILISNFFNSGIEDAADIGRKINDLRSERINADYDLLGQVTKGTAELVFWKTNRIIDNFSKIDRNALKAGMLAYQEKVKNTRTPPS
jgi:uncharacterized protein (UPF0332 family)